MNEVEIKNIKQNAMKQAKGKQAKQQAAITQDEQNKKVKLLVKEIIELREPVKPIIVTVENEVMIRDQMAQRLAISMVVQQHGLTTVMILTTVTIPPVAI